MRLRKTFSNFAWYMAHISGKANTFIIAFAIVIIWCLTGPFFGFSDTWQLVINTWTNIVAFLMVFVIQNTQNRDSEAMQIKLDELIRVQTGAHKVLLDLEELTQEQLDDIKKHYEKLAREARHKQTDTK
jgi:low affinity Fe/Cu permease